jgi:hypothetical protein
MLTERLKEAHQTDRDIDLGAPRGATGNLGVTGTAAQSRTRHRRALFNIAHMTICYVHMIARAEGEGFDRPRT